MIRKVTGFLAVMTLWGCGIVEQPAPVVTEPVVAAPAPAPVVVPPAPVIVAVPDPEPREGGIGGTGIEFAGQEGGMGGTGAPKLAAAVGTVHDFGSIFVNGVRVVFPPSGSVRSPSGFVSESDIDLGETLEILGVRQPDGTVLPTEAMFRFPLTGRVDHVDPSGHSFTIMGARVVPERGALIVDGNGQPVPIKAGDFVQVSGLLRSGLVVASRSVLGVVRINGVTVDYGGSQPPQVGWTVRVTGAYETGRLVPYETVRSLTETVSTPIADVTVEGYLEPRASAAGVGISGFGREFDAGSKVAALSGERALFIGALENGTFKARHGLRLPNDLSERRARLRRVEDGYAPAGAIETR